MPFNYVHKLRVRYSETDKMGFVYHSRFVEYFEAARVEALRSNGISYADLEKSGTLMPVVHIELDFKRPAFYDELLSIALEVRELENNRSVTFHMSTLNEAGDLLNKGIVVLAYVDAETMKSKPAPEYLQELFLKASGDGAG